MLEVGNPDWGSLKFETIKFGHVSRGTRTSESALARPSRNSKLQIRPLIREGAP
jgi:hypothetical protein